MDMSLWPRVLRRSRTAKAYCLAGHSLQEAHRVTATTFTAVTSRRLTVFHNLPLTTSACRQLIRSSACQCSIGTDAITWQRNSLTMTSGMNPSHLATRTSTALHGFTRACRS